MTSLCQDKYSGRANGNSFVVVDWFYCLLFSLSLIILRIGISILRTLVLSDGSQRKTQTSRPYQRPRIFWFRPGRTSTWWANFVNEDVCRLTSTSHQVMYAFLSVLVSGQP